MTQSLEIINDYQGKNTTALLLGSGELGKEVAIELLRYGITVVACDRYDNAPAMQVAQKKAVINMRDEKALRELIEQVKPDYIIPEIEAIATQTLVDLEKEGYHVVPAPTPPSSPRTARPSGRLPPRRCSCRPPLISSRHR